MKQVVRQALESPLGRAQLFIFGTAFYFEVIAAVCIIIGLIVTFFGVPEQILLLTEGGSFIAFLTFMFNIIIGIELLKMFCRHDLDSVVEVLLFAVARQVIIEHTTMVDNLLCMIAVALLFCIRKFLFVSALDKKEPQLKAVHPQLRAVLPAAESQPGGFSQETAASQESAAPSKSQSPGGQSCRTFKAGSGTDSREGFLKKYSRSSHFE